MYYSDELNDDFAGLAIQRRPVKSGYRYFNGGIFGKLKKLFVYRCLLTPVVWIYSKLICRIAFKNKGVMKGYKKRGCFIYGNHTSFVPDAFDPTYIAFPRPADIIVGAETTSLRGLGGILRTAGALPIPDDVHGMMKFNAAVTEAIDKRHWVAVYPEAHIWPYYTKIRPFKAVSFKYPVRCCAPVFSFTMTYKKRRTGKKPKRTVYIDGPFFPDMSLPVKAAQQKLRDEVYAAMCERARESDYSYVEYVYKPQEGGLSADGA